MFDSARRQPAVAAQLDRMIDAYSGWHWVNQDPARQGQPPAFACLELVDVPTLILVGERDVPDFRAVSDVLATRIPGARQVILPGVGHMANMEAPGRFNQAVLDGLASHLRSRPPHRRRHGSTVPIDEA